MSRAPSCWTPPWSLVHLPPGEAVRVQPWEVFGAPATYPPSTAPGFQRALALGLLPAPPPAAPPALQPGLSSWDRIRLAMLLCFGGLVLGLLLANGLDKGMSGLIVSLVTFPTGVWLFYSVEHRDEVELAAGYTSSLSYTGVWRLGRDGRVLRAPDPSVPPPGWYPSPYYPGVLQRWEGPGWKPLMQHWWRHEDRYFRAPTVPFL
jgi:hypothetical protein